MYVFSIMTYTNCVGKTHMEVVEMDIYSIGANLRKVRTQKKLRQEDVAERADLSVNYVGAVERGERIPSLETFIKILNAIGTSADIVLCDVLDTGYEVKNSLINDKLKTLRKEDVSRIHDLIDVEIKHSQHK